MRVEELVSAITAKSGVSVPENTMDRFIAGDLHAEITGIGTTFMATVDVIRRAAELGANLIITHEPTFYTGFDRIDWAGDNRVYQKKQDLIRKKGISIWRFHDHSHFMKPDLIYQGMTHELGWEAYQDPNEEKFFNLPGWNIKDLAKLLKEKLGSTPIRLVGSGETICRRAGLFVGAYSMGMMGEGEEWLIRLMQKENLDVLLCGEMLEWTTCAYARDAGMLGENHALLVLGHTRSEEAAMRYLIQWIRPLAGDLPIHYIEAGDPFAYL
jgi:putative NIF3 family GTP cyclohydrolase 1 type 2